MNKLKERRLVLGMTQPQLAKELREVDPRMDTGMVSRFECGACLPTEEVLKALERALQASRDDLFPEGEYSDDGTGTGREPSPTTFKLAAAIPVGRENAITRQSLAKRLGMSDRDMREAIERARADGLFIINTGNGRGYYQTDDLAEITRQVRQDTRRAMSILRRRKPMRDYLKSMGVAV